MIYLIYTKTVTDKDLVMLKLIFFRKKYCFHVCSVLYESDILSLRPCLV